MARSTTFKYTVTVVSDSGNKYAIDGNTQQYVVLFPGCTYEFNQDDSSNGGHPLRFSETSDGTHNSGSEYTTGVTTSGTPGSATAFTKIEVTTSTPVILYYYCTQHSGMGGNVDIPGGSGSGHTDRAAFAGGFAPAANNTIDYIQISTEGNASDFGDLTQARGDCVGGSSTTRGIQAGGDASPVTDKSAVIDYFQFATKGNAADFGDLTQGRTQLNAGSMSNKTRVIFGPGYVSPAGSQNIIDFITITSMGNAVDFGDRYIGDGWRSSGGAASSTRAIFSGGRGPSGNTNVMDYVTLASTGNSTDFGDQTVERRYLAGLSSSTRAVYGAGRGPSPVLNTMDYVTIASTGNATDFGDLLSSYTNPGTSSNSVRGIFTGGTSPESNNTIQYITIASTGNATNFGDLTVTRGNCFGSSGSHGGLQ